MDNNTEKYGIELDLLITKFKNKVNQVKNDIKGLGDQAKANVGDIKVDINLKTLDKDIANTKAQIQSLNEQMQEYQKYGYTSSPFYKSLSDDLSKATQKLKLLEQAQSDLNNEMQEGEAISSKSTIKIGRGFSTISQKISRYALSLFSLGTIYSLVSRASSAYLSQDIELANKLQSAWVGLGAILAPIIEKIADLILKVVGYINVFAQALTGVNYIAKATSKYMNNVANSAKKASKQLASFDEINNLSSDTSAGETSNNPFEAFDNIELNPKLVESLQNLAYWLKENWNWIKIVGEALVTAFAISKIMGIVSNISKVTNALGMGGLMGALAPFITLGAIAITFYIAGNIEKDTENLKRKIQEITDGSLENLKIWLDTEPAVDDVYNTMNVNNEYSLKMLRQTTSLWAALLGLGNDYIEVAETNVLRSGEQLEYLKKQYEQGDLNEEQQKRMVSQFLTQLDVNNLIIAKMQKLGMDTSKVVDVNKEYAKFTYEIYQNMLDQGMAQDEVLTALGLTKTDLEDIYNYTKNNDAVIDFQADTNDMREELNNALDDVNKNYGNFLTRAGEAFGSLFTKIGNSLNNLGSDLSKVFKIGSAKGAKGFASFDVGTNYVPSDMLANIHKGEAIIPKKFNNREFLSNMGGSQETNALLIDLIDAVNNIEINPYTTVKDVGKASVNYINQQNRIQGKSVIK